jgi:diguanylate cyclase (GGDEF)-like protein
MDMDGAKAFLRNRPVAAWAAGGALAGAVTGLAAFGVLNAISPAASGFREAGLALIASLLVATPLAAACGAMASRVESLRKQVQRLGQNDNLTACLNETTFSALVDTYANRADAQGSNPVGTILLVNLDDLRTVNRRFGFTWGNEALSLVAGAIKKTVRNGDIVGRIAGDRFGVFLPGASEVDARHVAGRVHDSIAQLQFYPTGTHFPLSVRAGAVIVSNRIAFDDLLNQAENTLALTRETGRNWIEYALPQDVPAVRPRDLQ